MNMRETCECQTIDWLTIAFEKEYMRMEIEAIGFLNKDKINIDLLHDSAYQWQAMDEWLGSCGWERA